MKRLFIVLISIVAMTNLYAQNQDIAYPHVTPLTPNAAEIAKYADYPISYYTGTPNTSIPLYEINVDGFKLPIGLNYHASGVRVDQEATWVGLGWSLDVGSRISRTVKSVDDFLISSGDMNYPRCEKGYYDAPDLDANLNNHYKLNGYASCPPVWAEFQYDLIYDPEPDIFYYNLPGMSGKFILDKSRGAVLFDKSHNLKIEIIRSPGIVTFKIIDNEGNQYLYNQSEITKNYSANTWLNKNSNTLTTVFDDETTSFTQWSQFRLPDCSFGYTANPQNPYPMVTSWCLTKITTKNGREINFTYDAETQYLPTQESCENYNYNGQTALYYNKSKVVNSGLRLKTISGDFGRIEFTCTDRFDIKGNSKKLEAISIYSNINALIKSFKFEYSYFNNDYAGNAQYQHVFKRLKLNKVTEYSPTTPLNKGYSFNYYEGNFPAKNSKNVDYWGFQNGKNYGENYYIGLKINNVNYPGVKKDANFDKAIIGTLKKITYPTGGTVEYKFESNTIPTGYFETHTYEPISTSNSIIKDLPVYNHYSVNSYPDLPPSQVYTFQINAPTTLKISGSLENSTGLVDPTYNYRNTTSNPLGRLRKISPAVSTLYTYDCPYVYDSGSQAQGSEITLNDREFTLDVGTYEFTAYTPPRDVLAYWRLYYQDVVVLTPGIPKPAYDLGGIRVSEIKTDAKIRRFKYPMGTMLAEPVFYYLGRRSGIPNHIASCIVQTSESKAPLSTFNQGNFVGYDWVEEYAFDDDDDISTIRYTYYNDTESDKFNDNFPDSPSYLNYTNGLTKSIEKFTTKYGSSNILVERDDFTYTSTYSNFINVFRDRGQKRSDYDVLPYYYKVEWPLKTKLTNTLKTDDGNTVVSETNYTYNSKDLLQSTSYKVNNSQIVEKVKYPFDFNDAISLSMVSKNMIGTPIETFTLKDNIVVQGRKTEYFNNSGVLLPKTIFKAEFDTPVLETNFNSTFYKPFLDFDSYNTKGNLLQFKYTNGTPTYYIWGYNEQYPIAKLENFTATDAGTIQSIITAAVNASNADTTPSLENALRAALTNLRNAAPNAMVTTYTYDPLIGVTSIIDTKGYIIYYQYDEFNRLKHVVDADGNIVSKNEYNYQQ
ncbi:hypothetical protein D3C85_524770 [compost metagenome]